MSDDMADDMTAQSLSATCTEEETNQAAAQLQDSGCTMPIPKGLGALDGEGP